jgi:hypothetical protein
VAAEHPRLVEGLVTPPPMAGAAGAAGAAAAHAGGGNGDDPLRLSEANLARLALWKGHGASVRGGGGSSASTGRGPSAASAAGSLSLTRGNKRRSAVAAAAFATAPSVTTAGTRLSVAETVIARAQARKGMF